MVFYNNRLLEMPLFDESEPKPEPKPEPEPEPGQVKSRTEDSDFVEQEENLDQKHKRIEVTRMHVRYQASPVDAAHAHEMENIHHTPTPPGHPPAFFNNPFYHGGPPPGPGGHTSGNNGTFFNNDFVSHSDISKSLSGETLVPNSFAAGSCATVQPTYHGCTSPFDPSSVTSLSSYFGGASMYGSVPTTYRSAPSSFLGPTYFDGSDLFASTPPVLDTGKTKQAGAAHADLKQELAQDGYSVSATPMYESDIALSESEDERPYKAPKLNKDGVPRKPRQPRAKLLKWSDDDWKNVCLGIVWACGETGVPIPFEQAAQVVGEKCTAGALQQALLKLRGKQIAEGYQIPNLKMAWTRKNRHAAPGAITKAFQEPEAKRPRKKPTRVEATQTLLVTVPRAYNDEDRQGIVRPYKWKKSPRRSRSLVPQSFASVKKEGAGSSTFTQVGDTSDSIHYAQSLSASQDAGYLRATPMIGLPFHDPSSVAPFGHNTGHVQGMEIGGGEYANLFNTDGIHDFGDGFADATDDVYFV